MALNPYINSFDTQADYDDYLDGSTAKAPNVAYIRATDEMKYTKTVPNPTWIIYGTTTGTEDFYVGTQSQYGKSSASNGIHLHVQEGIFYATTDDVVGKIAYFYGETNGFKIPEGQKITKIKRWTYPNTDVVYTREMFSGCSNLTSIDMSSFDASKITNMNNMFRDCTSLTSADFSSFNTSNVTDMGVMFSSCNFTSLDLSSFNTSNVTDMGWMFSGCSNLTTLDIRNFDTTKVANMNSMFNNCSKINKFILGAGFFNSKSISTFNLSPLTAWTDADSLETFVQAAEVHDGTGKTISLSYATKNALTQAQKDRLTGAGWTLS